jgi:hypothetical protein
MSLLRDIQNELASPGTDVTNVLRKCKILAARLGSRDFSTWVDWELNGYPESQPTPEYRKLPCSYWANFMNLAWRRDRVPIPATIAPEKYRDRFECIEFRDGVAKAVAFTGKGSGARIERPELIGTIQKAFSGNMDCYAVWTEMAGSDFEQMVSAIKNRILDFVLQIEAENPDAGEAAINSQPIAAEKVQSLVHNHFYAAVGNIAQGSRDFTQNATVDLSSEDLAKFVSEFTKHLDELKIDQLTKQKAATQLATLKTQESDPNPVIVSEAGRTLRNLTEGAIASLLATAAQPHVWHWIRQVLQSFN